MCNAEYKDFLPFQEKDGKSLFFLKKIIVLIIMVMGYSQKKSEDFLKINCEIVCTIKNVPYLCTRFWKEHLLKQKNKKRSLEDLHTIFLDKAKYKIYKKLY